MSHSMKEGGGAPAGTPDRDLVEQAQSHPSSAVGRAAAGELLRRYRRPVYVWCFRYVGEHERALDMAQEVLLSAYQRLGEFEGRAAFSSWLFVIARNRCLNEMRNDARREDIEPDSLVDDGPGFDERLESEMEGQRLLDLAARVLDGDERKAIWLRYSELLPVDEITTLMNLDHKSGARALLQRARRKLRAAWESQ
ncbi:MAG TPA: sigma-70 family RNA polymerase sigma factor [Candidatus Krumholzibacteria bacterium]|nr:sigma-70 family RNA polymerase sigma factor [Candidatus Krumholzibacteria bacterium]